MVSAWLLNEARMSLLWVCDHNARQAIAPLRAIGFETLNKHTGPKPAHLAFHGNVPKVGPAFINNFAEIAIQHCHRAMGFGDLSDHCNLATMLRQKLGAQPDEIAYLWHLIQPLSPY